MENPQAASGDTKDITIRLSRPDFDTLERFRGDLSPDAFLSALLRMLDSGAVMSKPEWVKEKEAK